MPYSMCPGCKKLRPMGTQCPCRTTKPRQWKSKNTRVKGKYDHAWTKARAEAIRLQPWCSRCGRTDDLTGDHIQPLSLGGSNRPDNIRVLCRSCNSSKGNGMRKR